MKPTKGQYMVLADILGDALDRCAEVRFYGDSVFVAHKALRLAANMPREEEIKTIVFHYTGDPQYPDYSGAAVAILKRLGVEG